MIEFILLFVIVAFSFSIKSLTGFGNTLIVNGAFSFMKENRFTTPVELIWNIPTNLWLVWKNRRHLDLPYVLPICAIVLVGEVAGTWLLTLGSDAVLRTCLGLVLIALGAEMLFNTKTYTLRTWLSAAVAVGTGVMLGLFGIGAPIAALMAKTKADREGYRSNVCFVFLADNLFRAVLYGVTGIITWETLRFSFLLFPAVALGMAFGRLADRRMDAKTVRTLVIVLLLVTGVVLAIRYRFGL